MTVPVEEALKRLQNALGQLERTVARRLDAEHRRGDLETELQLMQDDRARLAVELESSASRLSQVETAASHVEHRVHAAIGAIRDVLAPPGDAQNGTADPPASDRQGAGPQEVGAQEAGSQETGPQETGPQETGPREAGLEAAQV